MFVRAAALRDFRSWDDVVVEFDPGVTVFEGRNGHGKTNIVEALGYLSTLASHRVSSDQPLIGIGADAATVRAAVVNGGRELTIEAQINRGRPNRARLGGSSVRPAEILGVLRTVLFAPEDLALVRGDPGERRRFLDESMTARRPRWAAVRAEYDKVLRQRAALLKTAGAAMRRGDGGEVLATLDVWDDRLARVGATLIAARIAEVHALAPYFADAYATIAPQSRPASIRYVTSLTPSLPAEITDPGRVPRETDRPAPAGSGAEGPAADESDREVIEAAMLDRLAQMRGKELDRGVCLVGPHRDDLEIVLGDGPAKGFASHGESWSLALSLRLAVFELQRAEDGDPVLILDDVFAELDRPRRTALAQVAAGAEQVLITAAVPDDVPEQLRAHRFGVRMIERDGVRISELIRDEVDRPGAGSTGPAEPDDAG